MATSEHDPNIRKYVIGEFARKAGVSTHFLKFYEEKGILYPEVKENGYRYYDTHVAGAVLECFRMKNMGFSVKQIEKGIKDCAMPEVEENLAQQEKELLRQLHIQQTRLLGLQNLRAALRLCEQNEWTVRTMPAMWFLPHTKNDEFVPDERIYDQLPEWLEWMPLVTSAQLLYCSPDGTLQNEWGLCVEQEEAEKIGFCPQAPAKLLSQKRVLELYGSWKTWEDDEPWFYQHCRERARQLELVPGDTVLRRSYCYTEKDGESRVHCSLRVSVKLPE